MLTKKIDLQVSEQDLIEELRSRHDPESLRNFARSYGESVEMFRSHMETWMAANQRLLDRGSARLNEAMQCDSAAEQSRLIGEHSARNATEIVEEYGRIFHEFSALWLENMTNPMITSAMQNVMGEALKAGNMATAAAFTDPAPDRTSTPKAPRK